MVLVEVLLICVPLAGEASESWGNGLDGHIAS
jgi:hypothetical protein